MNRDEIAAALAEYKWYHRIRVAEGIYTPGVEGFVPLSAPVLKAMDRVDFGGRRVLDVGCRDGLFSFEAERRGASDVLGIDTCLSTGAVEFLIPHLKSAVKMWEMSLYELRPDEHGLFDVVLFPGVLYHLRFPFNALRTLTDMLEDGGRLIIETALYADAGTSPLLYCPSVEESPYEGSSVTFFNFHGLSSSLRTFGVEVDESFYIDPSHGRLKDESIVRGTLLCTRKRELEKPHLRDYWSGGEHRTWRKS